MFENEFNIFFKDFERFSIVLDTDIRSRAQWVLGQINGLFS